VFEAASTSKPVFAYAVMKLCERGVMDLDTPLTHYTSLRYLDDDPRLGLIAKLIGTEPLASLLGNRLHTKNG
jgi:hypothetical protein